MAAADSKEATEQFFVRIADLDQEPLEALNPIGGYENQPLVSLLEAVEPLTSILPAVQTHAFMVKAKCENPADGLTPDESASIMLYTKGWSPLNQCLYYALNAILRSPDRQEKLPPWYLYLRLFLGALFRLPSISQNVFRGVKLDLSKGYVTGKSVVWWGFSSCTTSVGVLKNNLFLGTKDTRTMFSLDCNSAKDIRNHSYYPSESEVLLLPATQFKVVSCLPQDNLQIVQLKETTPPFPLLQPIPPIKSNAKVIPNLPVDARWEQQGVTAAGGHGEVGSNNQLKYPHGMFVDDDDDQTIVIADHGNHRVMQWKRGDTQGQVVAGGNDKGNRLDQLDKPTDVLINKETNSLIIADLGNRRVVRWSRRSGTRQGEILIENIKCHGLAMDEQRYLYVSDIEKNEVRRYQIDLGDQKGTLVAGGNRQGNALNQLHLPVYLFVDRNQSLYVSDFYNHRVMKWDKGAVQGVVIAGGQGNGTALTQLSRPNGIFVDTFGTLYVAEGGSNQRVTRWLQESEKKGTVVVGGNGAGSEANQLNLPVGLSFDKHGNLYVVDNSNHRVQRFNLII